VIEFRILGPLEAVGDEGPIPLAGRRQRALLGLLLLRANEVVATERLVDALYGEQPPPTATTSLQNAVSRLRKLLGPDLLVTRPPGYVLKIDREQLDLARFERLVREARTADLPERSATLRDALALWRGPALADLAYETFAQAEIHRLEELRLAAVEERIDADLALGHHDELVGEIEALIAEQPLRERPRGLLMLALYRSGRQAEALRVYHDARRVLIDELGIEPSPALQQLHAAILRQERSLQPAGPTASDDDHYSEVVKAFVASRVVPVLGPLAVFCGRPENSAWEKALAPFLPGDDEVALHLAREFGFPANHGLPHISQVVALTRGLGPLYDVLHDVYGREYPSGPVHRLLAALPPLLRARGLPCQLIVTTGYDTTLERVFAATGQELDTVSYIAAGRDRGKFLYVAADGTTRVVHEANLETGITTDERTVLLKLHGGVDNDPRRERESFVVREDDYIDYLVGPEAGAAIPVSLAVKLRRSHFLFMGYALEEWSLRVFLRRLWGEERVAYRSWAVQPGPDPVAVEYWRQRGVDAFDVPLEEYVAELARRVEDAVAHDVTT
jgi:DNA-binding SARP family transcriptional activator